MVDIVSFLRVKHSLFFESSVIILSRKQAAEPTSVAMEKSFFRTPVTDEIMLIEHYAIKTKKVK